MTNFTIIIPTVNRPEDLEKTLECFLVQNLKSFQIILVDQSDNDRSEYVSNVYTNKWLTLNYYKFMIKSWAQARNFAIDKIDYLDNISGKKTEIVVFLDDDVSFEPDFLYHLGKYIESKSNIVWGTWKINSPSRQFGFSKKIWQWLLWWWRNINQQIVTKLWFNQLFSIQPTSEEPVQWTGGCGMWFRKSTIDTGRYRFPEYFLKYSIMEDVFFSYSISCNYPGLLTYTPTTEMIHHESPNRSIPNYQKIRQHCIHRYIFHKTFGVSMIWYMWTILLLMVLDFIIFWRWSILAEYFKSLIYVHQNRKKLSLDEWDYNIFIFDL